MEPLAKYGISEKMWKEICRYAHETPGVNSESFNILEVQNLDGSQFFIKDERGERGVSDNHGLSIYLAESIDEWSCP